MPSRGCPSSASKSAASSATDRPIVPPAPAEFSSRSQSRSSVSSSSSRSGGHGTLRRPREADAEVRADVEDDALGADRGGGLQRRAHRRDRLLVDLAVGRREVDEVERVADHGADARPRRDARETGRSPPSACAVGCHMRGLCVNTWTASQPSSLGPVDRRGDAARRPRRGRRRAPRRYASPRLALSVREPRRDRLGALRSATSGCSSRRRRSRRVGDRLAGIALAFAVLDIGSATELGLVFAARQGVAGAGRRVGGVALRPPAAATSCSSGASLVQGVAQAATAACVLAATAASRRSSSPGGLRPRPRARDPGRGRSGAPDRQPGAAAAGERAAGADAQRRRRARARRSAGVLVVAAAPGSPWPSTP